MRARDVSRPREEQLAEAEAAEASIPSPANLPSGPRPNAVAAGAARGNEARGIARDSAAGSAVWDERGEGGAGRGSVTRERAGGDLDGTRARLGDLDGNRERAGGDLDGTQERLRDLDGTRERRGDLDGGEGAAGRGEREGRAAGGRRRRMPRDSPRRGRSSRLAGTRPGPRGGLVLARPAAAGRTRTTSDRRLSRGCQLGRAVVRSRGKGRASRRWGRGCGSASARRNRRFLRSGGRRPTAWRPPHRAGSAISPGRIPTGR
jgi:hypothetical protein